MLTLVHVHVHVCVKEKFPCMYSYITCMVYRIAGNFKARKNFVNFCCFVPISVRFLHNCLKAQWIVGGTSEQSTNVFSTKSYFSIDSHSRYILYFLTFTCSCNYVYVLTGHLSIMLVLLVFRFSGCMKRSSSFLTPTTPG